jgi:anti-sigma regulatory factor (Ser/Thr protein kinase)
MKARRPIGARRAARSPAPPRTARHADPDGTKLPELAEVVELVVSELVTNSVQASAGLSGSRYHGRWRPGRPPVRLWLQSDQQRVLVKVWDGNDRAPNRQQADPEAESGRGLLLVETVSEACGVYQPHSSSGKVVWA